eukprot:CAMPEP_0172478620 /NCGR_PEP_ID=MMETSP1066-20121228/2670_1 /TAXON_ID=671091 /ORGANISM="Coscinodiscus wailesii, Strain CCMP2513" /LENGTH=144 /DNA_ID=CAMNT_0013238351 /DNA_START=1076 /DNA_END=1510 /DNA_ORIENTATION=-
MYRAVIIVVIIIIQVARATEEDTIASLMGGNELTRNVAGDGACFTVEKYADSTCSGDPTKVRTETIANSLEGGCDAYGSHFRSVYCAEDGYHDERFGNQYCVGHPYLEFNYENGSCDQDYNQKVYCTLDGSCGQANWIDLFLND